MKKFIAGRPTAFSVKRYAMDWTSANLNYEYTFHLVPTITLYESSADNIPGAIAFLYFRQEDQVKGASYDLRRDVYYADFPLAFAAAVVHLIERKLPLQVVFKREADRQSLHLLSPAQPLVDMKTKKAKLHSRASVGRGVGAS